MVVTSTSLKQLSISHLTSRNLLRRYELLMSIAQYVFKYCPVGFLVMPTMFLILPGMFFSITQYVF